MPNSSEKTPRKTTRAKSPTATPKPRTRTAKAAPVAPETTSTTAVALAEPETVATAIAPTREDIARRAHDLYVKAGRPAGRDLEFWLEAERQLRSSK